nr:sigma-54 dependent transcriptional regulator [uncultured Prevotella sp.]
MAIEKKGKILIVDDNEDVLLSLNMLLKPYVEGIRVINTPERIIGMMDSFMPDVIMLDMNFHRDAISGEEGYEWLEKILAHNPKSVVLFITAYVDTEKAVRAIKAGAIDFIPKPWDRNKLLDTVKSAVELSRERNLDSSDLIGECPAMQELKAQMMRVAATDANVLITGENGTGKDVVAHALHQLSDRARKPFVNIDLGCIPENLFESELFGYEKGAFTDARNAKEGRIETADGGTLFLDEIGNLNLPMQQKLLTVIEKRETQRIGSNKVSHVNVRILAATNVPLREKVGEGTFRQDLFYRLNTIELHLPPLRERGEDIVLLAEYFLKIYSGKYSVGDVVLGASAKQKLLKHTWPGNVRELQHCIERAIVLGDKTELAAEDIRLEDSVVASGTSASNSATGSASGSVNIDSLNLQTLEREAIKRAISLSNGNLTQAAELLGITRFALYRKIDKLGV